MTSASNSAPSSDTPDIFHISPLIRLTLLSLYVALTLPLPFLAGATQAPVPPWLLSLGVGVGAIALHGALSQQVVLDTEGIQVTYPQWVRWVLRKGWQLRWDEVTALKPRSTGQGGLVYYFVGTDQQAYLLPMRVAGFARLVGLVESRTGIDTQDVKPLAQPWMYGILLLFTLFLLLIDSWTIWTASQLG
ncbi:MAG TPA: hypothetical protein V6D07_17885 [Trichocoleus sp.]